MLMLKKTHLKILAEPLKNQRGLSVAVVAFVLVVLGAIAFSFINLMAAKQKTIPITAHSTKAFYIAEGGIHWSAKYLAGETDWTGVADRSVSAGNELVLGDGQCELQFSYNDLGCDGAKVGEEAMKVTATGHFVDAVRQVSACFYREPGGGCGS